MQSIKAFKEMILSYLETTNNNITKKMKDKLKVFVENNFNSTMYDAFESIKSSELFEHCLSPFLPQKGWLIFWKYKNPKSTKNENDGVIGIVKKVNTDNTKDVVIFNTEGFFPQYGFIESINLKEYEEENVGKLELIGYAKISLGLEFILKEFNKISNVKINTNIDLSILDLIDYLKSKPYYENKDKLLNSESNGSYEIYTDPYVLNIVGIRSCIGFTPKTNNYKLTNKFDDKIIVFRKIPGLKYWQIFKFAVTTKPGNNGDSKIYKMLYPSQYKDKYKNGYHRQYAKEHNCGKNHPALHEENEVFVGVYELDKNNLSLKTDNENCPKILFKNIGINIHTTISCSSKNRIKNQINVDTWSEGCQVFQDPDEHQDIFIKILCKDQEVKGKKSLFTYTLIEEFDFLSYIANQKQ